MTYRPLSVSGAWETTPVQHGDPRGVFLEAFRGGPFAETVMSLCSTRYSPGREHGIHPLDPALAIDCPTSDRHGNPATPKLSAKDTAAPSLAEAARSGSLPSNDAVTGYIETLRP